MQLDNLYSLRKSFSIIGLTGRTGSGCSDVGAILSKDTFTKLNIRNPTQVLIPKLEDGELKHTNFSRKFRICYDYSKVNWKTYKVIEYKNVILLQVIYAYLNKKEDLYIEIGKFFPDNLTNIQLEIEKLFQSNKKTLQQIKKLGDLYQDFKDDKSLNLLYSIFFGSEGVETIGKTFFNILNTKSIPSRIKFLHTISNNLRKIGTPWTHVVDNTSMEYIYTTAKIINKLIKSYKNNNKDLHIVIDSLRNSLELLFFKERFSAFYMVSVNSDATLDNIKESLKDKYEYNEEKINEITNEILAIDNIEYKSNHFREGKFWAPDIENCIQKCDIHIKNNVKAKIDNIGAWPQTFFSLDEQVMKFTSLILQPGLITPSSLERCMQFAFNAKCNSGCISRQVGAVITDQNYSIKAVGWNDVPANNIPCNLRNIKDLISESDDTNLDKKSFSPFEKGKIEGDSVAYNKFIKNKYDVISDTNGKNCSYCFKSNYNYFKGENNQVHTRSLHAEENAMLQISKYGGQGLENGILFTTASPCELCSKKAYQLGIKRIIYVDPYPGISREHILSSGISNPYTELFTGAIGASFHKLYEPFMPYKDELTLITSIKPKPKLEISIENMIKEIDTENTLSDSDKNKIVKIRKKDLLKILTNFKVQQKNE